MLVHLIPVANPYNKTSKFPPPGIALPTVQAPGYQRDRSEQEKENSST